VTRSLVHYCWAIIYLYRWIDCRWVQVILIYTGELRIEMKHYFVLFISQCYISCYRNVNVTVIVIVLVVEYWSIIVTYWSIEWRRIFHNSLNILLIIIHVTLLHILCYYTQWLIFTWRSLRYIVISSCSREISSVYSSLLYTWIIVLMFIICVIVYYLHSKCSTKHCFV